MPHLHLRPFKWPLYILSSRRILTSDIYRASAAIVIVRYEIIREDLIAMVGVIVDKQPKSFFKFEFANTDHMVFATISGRMGRNRIRILVGDRVDV